MVAERGGRLPSEDGNLLTEHDHLDGQITAVALAQAEHLEDSDEFEIEKRQSHGSVSCVSPVCESPDHCIRMTFSAPTVPKQLGSRSRRHRLRRWRPSRAEELNHAGWPLVLDHYRLEDRLPSAD